MKTDEENKYDFLINENKIQINIYEEQISKLIECTDEINTYLSFIEENYPNSNKFNMYAFFQDLWRGIHRDKFANGIEMAYDTSIKAFKNYIENMLEDMNKEILVLNIKKEGLQCENMKNVFLKMISE